MSKKVVIISASPRKVGNTDLLCDSFARGATEAGHQVEKIFIQEKDINYCTGCGACVANSHSGCVQQDDMNAIVDQLLVADTIVMATPIYFYTMNGQLKTFIDRCCAKYTQIVDKEFYFIMAAADSRKTIFKRTLEEFRGFLDCLDGSVEKGHIAAGGVWQKGDVQKTAFIDAAYQLGKSV